MQYEANDQIMIMCGCPGRQFVEMRVKRVKAERLAKIECVGGMGISGTLRMLKRRGGMANMSVVVGVRLSVS